MLTIYSKTQCPHCVNAKNFLKAKNIEFEEKNIETDETAREFLLKEGHRSSIAMVGEARDDVRSKYVEAVTGLVTPPAKQIITG